MRELAEKVAVTSLKVVPNALIQGYWVTGLIKEVRKVWDRQLYLMKLLLARTAEQGSRTLVHAASLGLEGLDLVDGQFGRVLGPCQPACRAMGSSLGQPKPPGYPAGRAKPAQDTRQEVSTFLFGPSMGWAGLG